MTIEPLLKINSTSDIARLGSGLPFEVSPNLGSSASPVSRRPLKFSFKSVASASSATPACVTTEGLLSQRSAERNVSLAATVPDFQVV